MTDLRGSVGTCSLIGITFIPSTADDAIDVEILSIIRAIQREAIVLRIQVTATAGGVHLRICGGKAESQPQHHVAGEAIIEASGDPQGGKVEAGFTAGGILIAETDRPVDEHA